MKTSWKLMGILAAPAVVMLAAVGCASRQCAQPCCGTGFNCYGYYSTCWRPWPEECPPCPSYAIVPRTHEEILSDVRIHENPALDVLPVPQAPQAPQVPLPPMNDALPLPPGDLPPELPPQEGRAKGGVRLARMPSTTSPKPPQPESR